MNPALMGTFGALAYAANKVSPYLASRLISRTLGNSPGVPAKISQLFVQKLNLQAPALDMQALPFQAVEALIAEHSPHLYQELVEISLSAEMGSIAQVHQGRLRDGRLVAIKVRYPGIELHVDAQIDAFMKLCESSPAANCGFDVEGYSRFLKERLWEEIDFLHEARTQNRMRREISPDLDVVIPIAYEDLSSQEILCQSFERGDSLRSCAEKLSADTVSKLARTAIELIADMIFTVGCLHADTHSENLAVRFCEIKQRWVFVLYDFGSVIKISHSQRHALMNLLAASHRGEFCHASRLLADLGFSESHLSLISSSLPKVVEELLKAWVDNRGFSFGHEALGGGLKDILAKDAWWFRTAGPPWFLYLMRSINGFHSGFSWLKKSTVHPWAILDKYLEHSDVSSELKLEKSREVAASHQESKNGARHLQIRVMEHKREKVSVTLPVDALSRLEDLMSPDVLLRLRQSQINLADIHRKARDSGYAPQVLFHQDLGAKSYLVELV